MTRAVLLLLAMPAIVTGQTVGTRGELADRVARMARIGAVGAPSFSADGRWLSVISNATGVPQVYVMPASGGWPRMITDGSDPVVGAVWSPAAGSDSLAVTIAPGGGLNTQVYVVRADGTGMRRLTEGGQENNTFNAWSHDGRTIYMDSNRSRPAARDLFAIEVETGRIQLVAQNPGVGSITSVTVDGRYALVSRVQSRGDNNLHLIELAPAGRDILLTRHTGVAQYFGEVSGDGRAVYVGTNEVGDLSAFARIRLDDAAGPGRIEVLRARTDAELESLRVNDQGTRAALVWNVGGRSELELFDLQAGRVIAAPTLPGDIAGRPLFSRDGTKLAAVISGSTQPQDVWISEGGAPFQQMTFAPRAGVDLREFVRPVLVTFPAHDGVELSGWLYRPPNVNAPAPFVLNFHGGPEGQDRPTFRPDYQALLSVGIGVFAPNVRGSTGFGKRFVNLDNGALRVQAVRDIKSSVDYLVARGIADARRVGISGGSYGGYMTMAGLTEYPELFAAGVNLYGIVNFLTFFQHTEPWMAAISTVEYGDPATQRELLERLSPLGKIDRIRAATMVQHGANDTNVPVVEAEQIVSHLKARNVPVEYILFPDEGHGWRKTPNRIRSIAEMVRFFDVYLHTP